MIADDPGAGGRLRLEPARHGYGCNMAIRSLIEFSRGEYMVRQLQIRRHGRDASRAGDPPGQRRAAVVSRVSAQWPSIRALGAAAFAVALSLSPSARAAEPTDQTLTFLMTPNFPTTTPLPVVPRATPGDGLKLESGARNMFSLVFGSGQLGANMTTSESIRDTFFMNYMTGDLHKAIGSPVDTGQGGNNVCAAVARHYAAGDPNDLHVMRSDGMALRAICARNHTDCSPGHVWAAMARLPAEIRPGMTIKVRYRSPKGPHSWAPIWMFSGSQRSPGQDGDPYRFYNTGQSLLQLPVSGRCFEIDLNDNFPRWYASKPVATGAQLDFGTPDISGVPWHTPPHSVYWADGNGYASHPEGQPPFEEVPFDWSAGFHDLVLSWESASNMLYEFVDGNLAVASYMEYPAPTYEDGFDNGKVKTQAMHLIIGNQAIPSFSPGAGQAMENDGIPDGWTIVVQEISAWYGNIAMPDSYRVAVGDCHGRCLADPAKAAEANRRAGTAGFD